MQLFSFFKEHVPLERCDAAVLRSGDNEALYCVLVVIEKLTSGWLQTSHPTNFICSTLSRASLELMEAELAKNLSHVLGAATRLLHTWESFRNWPTMQVPSIAGGRFELRKTSLVSCRNAWRLRSDADDHCSYSCFYQEAFGELQFVVKTFPQGSW